MANSRLWMVLVGITVVSSVARGQLISCTPGMITAFTPCINFITGSTSGGSGIMTPSEECCQAVGKLAVEGSGCVCSLIEGAVPFGLPINQSLAFTLPFACGEPSEPLFQCKSTVANNGTVPLPPFGLSPPATSPAPPLMVEAPSPATDQGSTLYTTPSAAIKGLDMVTLPLMLLMVLTLL